MGNFRLKGQHLLEKSEMSLYRIHKNSAQGGGETSYSTMNNLVNDPRIQENATLASIFDFLMGMYTIEEIEQLTIAELFEYIED